MRDGIKVLSNEQRFYGDCLVQSLDSQKQVQQRKHEKVGRFGCYSRPPCYFNIPHCHQLKGSLTTLLLTDRTLNMHTKSPLGSSSSNLSSTHSISKYVITYPLLIKSLMILLSLKFRECIIKFGS